VLGSLSREHPPARHERKTRCGLPLGGPTRDLRHLPVHGRGDEDRCGRSAEDVTKRRGDPARRVAHDQEPGAARRGSPKVGSGRAVVVEDLPAHPDPEVPRCRPRQPAELTVEVRARRRRHPHQVERRVEVDGPLRSERRDAIPARPRLETCLHGVDARHRHPRGAREEQRASGSSEDGDGGAPEQRSGDTAVVGGGQTEERIGTKPLRPQECIVRSAGERDGAAAAGIQLLVEPLQPPRRGSRL
jgi:hypothetical protein